MTAPISTVLRDAAAEGLEANAHRWLRFAGWRTGDYVEIQALNVLGKQLGAHAPDSETFVRLITEADESASKAQGIYVIANLVNTEVANRKPPGEWRLSERGSTTARDVTVRHVLYVDVDVVRDKDTSATDDQVTLACEVAERIYATLTAASNYNAVAVGHSGNGCALFVALDYLTETPELHAAIVATLEAIRDTYDTPAVKIDPSLVDTKRLVPAFGTIKRKGPPDDPHRPHRRTAIVVPEHVRRLSLAEFYHLRDTLVAGAPARTRPAGPIAPKASTTSAEDGLELGDLRKRIVELRRQKAKSTDAADVERYQIYSAILDGTPLAVSGGSTNRPDGVPAGRAKAVNKAASMLAFALPPNTAWEIAIELLRPCLTAMDYDPEGLEHWQQMAELSYERAMDRAVAAAHDLATRRQSEAFTRDALLKLGKSSNPDQTSAAPAGSAFYETLAAVGSTITSSNTSTSASSDDWVDMLIKGADLKPLSCSHNVHVILAHSPALKGTIRFNLVTKDIEVHGGPFAGANAATLSTAMMNWLHKQASIKVKRGEVEDQLLLVAHEHAYDPIADALNALKWDETPRLDEFFFTHAIARRVSEGGVDVSGHLRRVSAKFFISAVARALTPGCQVDTMLVLEGTKEGEGKTEMLRRLFHPWYAVTRMVGDKDALMLMAGTWGIEFGELSAVRRSDDDHFKSILDTRKDKFRLPYGRVMVELPRRCVFVGTTNNPQWLTPGKGRRRYWPVFIEHIMLELIDRDRAQLWAEAVVRFKLGERWHLTPEERAEADVEAEARVESSFVEEKIAEWWYGMQADRRNKSVTLIDVVESALKLQAADRVSRTLQTEIGFAMGRLGFTKGRQMVKGSRSYAWIPTPEMAGAKAAPSYMKLVADNSFDSLATARATK